MERDSVINACGKRFAFWSLVVGITLGPGIAGGAIPGDANEDGIVNGSDYTIWADNYLLPGSWEKGDFNSDGIVNGSDYTLWADHYGEESTPGADLPEPLTVLSVAAGLGLLARYALERRWAKSS